MNTVPSDINVFSDRVAAISGPTMHSSSYYGRADSHVRIKNTRTTFGQRKNEPFDEFDWKLTRVNGFLDVIVFYIWKDPNVARILSQRIARKLSNFWPFEIFFAGILRRHADGIEIEDVIVAFREPHDRFVAAGKSLGTMKAMLEMPNNSIAKFEAVLPKHRI